MWLLVIYLLVLGFQDKVCFRCTGLVDENAEK